MKSLSAKQAAARLGVRIETVYAYVSREILSRTLAPDGRSSRFDPAEVEALARRGRPRRGRRRVGTVDVSLGTSITRISPEGRLEVRGRNVAELAASHGYEEVAELLWTGTLAKRVRWTEEADRDALRVARALPKQSPPVERMAVVAAALACSRPLRVDLQDRRVLEHARILITTFIESLPKGPKAESAGDRRLAARLWPRLSAISPSAPRVRALDTALLLLADHELATSTLCTRVAASTRADPFFAVMAGLAAVSGSLHGRAASRVHRLLGKAAQASHPELVVAETIAESGGALPGYGHPVYQVEDPRAPVLLERVMEMARVREGRVIDAVREAGNERSSAFMNVDFALGALAFAGEMGLESSEAIFAIARTAGWIAHALEEYGEAPLRFRATALYDDAHSQAT